MEVKCIKKILNLVNSANNRNCKTESNNSSSIDNINGRTFELHTKVEATDVKNKQQQQKKHLHFVSIGSSIAMSMLRTYMQNKENNIVNDTTTNADGAVTTRLTGVRITGSTCPHYLIFDSTACSNGCTVLKCSPPIRDFENCIGLRQHIIDNNRNNNNEQLLASNICIGSAHIECDTRLKLMHTGDLVRSIGGIHSITSFAPSVYSSMVLCNNTNHNDNANDNKNKNIMHLVDKCCTGPAKLLGMVPKDKNDLVCNNDDGQKQSGQIIKGMLVVNGDADICIFNTSLFNSNIHVNKYQSRLSPYRKANQRIVNPTQGSPTIPTLYGNVVGVILKGKMVYNIQDEKRGNATAVRNQHNLNHKNVKNVLNTQNSGRVLFQQ
jgi:hypothetical protein